MLGREGSGICVEGRGGTWQLHPLSAHQTLHPPHLLHLHPEPRTLLPSGSAHLPSGLTSWSYRMLPPGSHSLKYRYTVMSRPAFGEPWFIAVCSVDDTQIVRFHSEGETARYELRASWVEQEGTEYWKKETEIVTSNAQFFRGNLQTILDYYNLRHDGE